MTLGNLREKELSMKTAKKIYGITFVLVCGLATTLKAQNLYVDNDGNGAIAEYGPAGLTINASLISGLNNNPFGIAISGNDLFVANGVTSTIGEYTTAGATINADLISGLDDPQDIAVIPEPSVITLAASGAATVAVRKWRHRPRFSRANGTTGK